MRKNPNFDASFICYRYNAMLMENTNEEAKLYELSYTTYIPDEKIQVNPRLCTKKNLPLE